MLRNDMCHGKGSRTYVTTVYRPHTVDMKYLGTSLTYSWEIISLGGNFVVSVLSLQPDFLYIRILLNKLGFATDSWENEANVFPIRIGLSACFHWSQY